MLTWGQVRDYTSLAGTRMPSLITLNSESTMNEGTYEKILLLFMLGKRQKQTAGVVMNTPQHTV